jgi:hypothetical protein
MQDRRVRLHRLVDIGHMGQDLVIDLDQAERLAGDRVAGSRHRGHGMTVIERLFPRHDIAPDIAQIGRRFREIVLGHHRLDAGQLERRLHVDGADAGMGMGAAQHLADQHAGHGRIGAEAGAPGYLVETVGSRRTGTDDLELAGFGR